MNINNTLKIPIESLFLWGGEGVDNAILYSLLKINGDLRNVRRLDTLKDSFQESTPNMPVK